LNEIVAIGNKIRSPLDQKFVTDSLPEFQFLGFIPYDTGIIDSEISGSGPVQYKQEIIDRVNDIYKKLIRKED